MALRTPATVRLRRTYEVTLSSDGKTVSFMVNMAYDVNEAFEAIEHGKVLKADNVMAQLAAVNRLRRLSAKGRVDVSQDFIEASDWTVTMVRQGLVDR